MFFRTLSSVVSRSFQIVRGGFLQRPGLPWSDVFTAEHIEQVFETEGVSFGDAGSQPIYTMVVTFWAMVSQALFTGPERACRAAVPRVAAYFTLPGRQISTNTGIYCRAPARVGEGVP
jgi:hypothetical protein